MYEEEPFLGYNTRRKLDVEVSVLSRHAKWIKPVLIHLVVFAAYTCAYVVAIRRVDSNATTALHEIDGLVLSYKPRPYDDFELSPYAGPPSHTLDTAWHQLLQHTTIRVTTEELRRSNQTSIELPEGGGNMAWLGVYHELHCIKMVRQWIYRDHYHPNLTDGEVEEWTIHADHCLDILRSAAMCHADTTLTTFGWANKTKPMLNTRPIDHKCIDWDALVTSVHSREVGSEEMAALVNPLL